MRPTPEQYRKHYAELSDEALLEINRDDLVEEAQQCLDAELAARNMIEDADEPAEAPAPAEPVNRMAVVAEYENPAEGELARDLLASGGIQAYLLNERMAALMSLAVPPGIFQLLVPEEMEEAAMEILQSEISEEELAAQAEAAGEAAGDD